MSRAIQLGAMALGPTAPNPAVGAVVVAHDRIIGEGHTSPFGGPHAEVNAIQAVREKSLLKESTLYVTLEPCSHFGKTPPCTELILKSGIPEVVIGCKDPYEEVAGSGIHILSEAGVRVVQGVMEVACRWHHRRFLTFHEKKRPYIILKWAMSKDGFLAPDPEKRKEDPSPYWISNPASRTLVHRWRSEEQSILVGTNTALHDNPRLDNRLWYGQHPTRVLIDRKGKVPGHFHLKDGSVKTLVFSEAPATEEAANMETIVVSFDEDLPQTICDALFQRNITSLIVEGGAQTLQTFLDQKLWDEARVFTGPQEFGSGLRAPVPAGLLRSHHHLGTNQLAYFTNDS